MIRAPLGNQAYWDKRVRFSKENIAKDVAQIQLPSKNPVYRPQFIWDLSIAYARLAITEFSMGESLAGLPQHLVKAIDAWELSNKLASEICKEHNLATCRDWDFSLNNLNHYNWCFWLVGLGLCLEIPYEQWDRLVALIGGEGEDVLLDRVIASRSPNRKVGKDLLHQKPYARLLKTVETPLDIHAAQTLTQRLGIKPYSMLYKDDDSLKGKQAALLREFVERWYVELKRPDPRNRKAPTIEPFWYIYGDPVRHPLEMGSYFGRWCIEAAAAVKAFGLDDSLCLGHEHYPSDLLRPNEPSTHSQREEQSEKINLFSRIWKSIKT